MRVLKLVMAISMVLFAISLNFSLVGDAQGRIPEATLSAGSMFTFSYDLQSLDGNAMRSGTIDAMLTETTWRGYGSFELEGSFQGSFITGSGSGTESGTLSEYYRKGDLALLDRTMVTDLLIGSNTVTNTTNLHYDPSLTWIMFPLEYKAGPEKSIWGTDPDNLHPIVSTTSWERIIDGDDQTKESGSDQESSNYDWICANLVKKTVDAGSFDTYWIREWIRNDAPRNMTTDYYYNETVGWFVEKNVYVDDDRGDQVRIEHYELKDHSVNGPPMKLGSPAIEMQEDTTDTSIDLDQAFSDPDGDDLVFAIVDEGAFTVTIDGQNRLSVTPPSNFFGNGEIAISARDPFNDPVVLTIPVEVDPVDDPPVLSEPGLDPLSGDEITVFTFSIVCRDIDSATPTTATVTIGTSSKDLAATSGDNTSGLRMEWSGMFAPGDLTHHFVVDGVRFPVSGEIQGPSVSERVSPYLLDGTVSPNAGDVNTDFTFEVTWTGPNGEVPEYVELLLDGETFTMTDNGGVPSSGISYTRTMDLEEGSHSFHFKAELSGNTYWFPKSGMLDGPAVVALEEPYLRQGSVDRDSGGLCTRFVVMDGSRTERSKSYGSPLTVAIYACSILLDEGEHSYHFEASLGSGGYRYPDRGDLEGPTVGVPEITAAGYELLRVSDNAEIYMFHVVYDYLIEVYPDSVLLKLGGIVHEIVLVSGSPNTGANYTLELELGEGVYQVMFEIVSEGRTLTESAPDLIVEFEEVPLDDDPDGSDAHDDRLAFLVIILVAISIAMGLVGSVYIILQYRARKADDDMIDWDR